MFAMSDFSISRPRAASSPKKAGTAWLCRASASRPSSPVDDYAGGFGAALLARNHSLMRLI